MSRLLFAWELGGGFGHLVPFLPIARALLARGHRLTVAARDVERAHIVFGSLDVTIVQAPLCTKTYNGLSEPPLNYAEILMRYGYLDAPLLRGLLRAWRGLLDITAADTLLTDHAPTALLAARGGRAARIEVGTTFSAPPRVNPTTNMRPWLPVPERRLASSDASVLNVINSSLAAGTPGLGAVHEIFDGADRLLRGVPELDHYGPRDARHYLGLHSGTFGSRHPRWPVGDGPRVFAYLQSDYRHLDALLAALAGSHARCVVVLPGTTPALRQKYEGARLSFSAGLLDVGAAVAGGDLCVCHGNAGTVMSILRHGKPMLLLPSQLEHFLLASRVETLGIARVIHPDAQPLDIAGALARALEDTALAGAARAFAERHREPSVDTIVQRVAERIESLARGSPA
ncbi:MAG TPA: nucleotide disphospho-sugar-binding domain-containing protein [Burkholderiales bacterium]|nr:nucleotide disphospho-sugar-binding domain-containing protein [Burkholderiales bacterium]